MDFIRSFFKRITDDLKQKKLIPLKILFFVHASTLFVLYPYLTIHMRELGINVEETAIMSAVTPVISIVMPPLAGMLADKIGNFRLLLALSSVLGGASALLLLAVPVGRITVTFPPEVELLATCDESALKLRHIQDFSCAPLHPYSYDINLTISSCGFLCEMPEGTFSNELEDALHTPFYDIHLQSRVDGQRVLFRHTVSTQDSRRTTPQKDQSTIRIMTNDPHFNTSISKVSDRGIFFPSPRLYEMECSRGLNNVTCVFGINKIFNEGQNGNKGNNLRVRVSHNAQTTPVDVREYWIKALSTGNDTKLDDDYDGVDNITCKDYYDEILSEQGAWVQTGSRELRRCSAACAGLSPRKSLCKNNEQQLELDPVFTFWAYLAVRVFIGIIGGTAFAMFEGAVIAIVREQKADYGMQRVYGSIGGMISSPLSGLLIDYASKGKGYTDFRPAFYLYAVLKVASGALMLSIDLEFKQPAQNLLEDVITVFKNIEIVALFIACFIMGTAWGYIESFLFWLLQDLGASRSLMGITITVGGVAGLPLLVLSGPIIRKLGHANVLFIGFIFYAIRLLGYSLIYNPWLCLIFEALESVTSSLSFTAAVTYAARLSSTTTDTSVQGLLGGLYYGVGKGSGSLIGGYLMKFFGTRPTYQMFAGATFITGCIYYLFNKFYIRKRSTGDDSSICKIKQAPADVESRDTDKENDKKTSTDVSSKGEAVKQECLALDKIPDSNQRTKLVLDNIDGSSDSGVDNPAYTETDSANGTRKIESKVNG
ncbi:uncharacterized protein LOC115445436 [Manduca sexta]|uniref:uncharacterized protein LOC115445436 n=1 Tax=Manduca sexta TaxID=7130 RepID=UPI00188DD403|nr:uncharacterized protein LOC115445436 [Manduca sexta]